MSLPREAGLLLLSAQDATDHRAAFFALLKPETIIELTGEELGLFLDLMWGPLGLDFGDALLMMAKVYDVPAAWVLRAELESGYTAQERAKLLADAMSNRWFVEALS